MEYNKQNREKILRAFKLRKEGKSLTQIEKATGIKRPYASFLFKNFAYDEIEQIVRDTNKIKKLKEEIEELEYKIKIKNKRIKELKKEIEKWEEYRKDCTCWETLSFFKKLDLMFIYIFISFLIGAWFVSYFKQIG